MPEDCVSCRRPKASFTCDMCHEHLCKECVTYLDSTAFSFRASVSEDLKHVRYCRTCYEQKVEPELHAYNEVLEHARGVYFFFSSQRKVPPTLRRSKQVLRVDKCEDRDATILHLAFQAAELGFNAVIDAEVISTKIRNAGYQKSWWQGSGFPAQVDAEKLEREARF